MTSATKPVSANGQAIRDIGTTGAAKAGEAEDTGGDVVVDVPVSTAAVEPTPTMWVIAGEDDKHWSGQFRSNGAAFVSPDDPMVASWPTKAKAVDAFRGKFGRMRRGYKAVELGARHDVAGDDVAGDDTTEEAAAGDTTELPTDQMNDTGARPTKTTPPPVHDKFRLPATAAEADKLVAELGQLATATEWKRAAIVHARVHVTDSPGRPTEKVNSDLLTPKQYAKLGIHGLRSKTTVRRYWRVWQRAIEEGVAEPVKLGDRVALPGPDLDWAEYFAAARVEPKLHPQDEHCLWGGLPDPEVWRNGAPVDLSLRPGPDAQEATAEDRGRVAGPEEWTDSSKELIVGTRKGRLQNAERDVSKAIHKFVAIDHEPHPPGSVDGDAKTQARRYENVTNWVAALTGRAPTPKKRLRDIKSGKGVSTVFELAKLQVEISQFCVVLEDFDVEDYDLSDQPVAWGVTDIFGDLVMLGEWLDQTMTSIQSRLSDQEVRAKITKMRDTTGRTPEEAETALRLADQIERKLENRLTAT
jgi:hypothetical protein